MFLPTAKGRSSPSPSFLPLSGVASATLLVLSVLTLPVFADNWPAWRGNGSGVSQETGLPSEWGPAEGVLWKTEIEGSGISSPVVWDNRVFITTAVTRSPLWYAPSLVLGVGLGALLLALISWGSRRKDRTHTGAKRIPGLVCLADRLGAMLALLLYTLGVFFLYARRDFFEPGAEEMAWRYTGAVGIVAVAAAVGLFDVRSRWRLLGSGVLVATLILYNTGGAYGGVSTKVLLISAGAGCVSAWWCLAFFLSPKPTDGPKPNRRKVIWPAVGPLALLLAGVLQFVLLNSLVRHTDATGSLICLDRDSGAILWQHHCFRTGQLRKHRSNSFATPTPVTDGQRVVARFGPGLVCLDFEGNVKWQSTIPGHSQHHYVGAVSSPVMFEDSVIYALIPDGQNPRSNDDLARYSRLTALDKETGDVKWQVGLPGGHDSYDTPLLVHLAERPVLLIATWEHLLAFDPRNGDSIHAWDLPVRQCIPSVVADDRRAYVMSGRDHGSRGGFAVELAAEEEGAQPGIAWRLRRDSANIASPTLHDGLLYMITRSGTASCVVAETGEFAWRERLGGMFYASVVAGDGKAYFTSLDGETTVVRLGRQYDELAKNAIGEGISASPAIAAGRLFIRGEKHLFCIGAR